jgi:hypothetical protein
MIMAAAWPFGLSGPDHRHRTGARSALLASVGIGVGGVYFWVNNKAKKRMA